MFWNKNIEIQIYFCSCLYNGRNILMRIECPKFIDQNGFDDCKIIWEFNEDDRKLENVSKILIMDISNLFSAKMIKTNDHQQIFKY